MSRAPSPWRRWLLCAAPAAVCAALASGGLAQEKKVDPAVTKLMAANSMFNARLFKLAADEYTEFLAKFPNHPRTTDARYGLALCQYRQGQHAEAAKGLAAVLKGAKFKQREDALAVMGNCLLSDKQYQAALTACDELLAKFPTGKWAETAALNRAQALYLMGKAKESLSACQAFLKKYPKSASRAGASYFLALSQKAVGKHGDAAATLAGLLKQFPNSPYDYDANLLLAQCLEDQKKLDAAAAQFAKLLKSAPPDRIPEVRYRLAVALYKAGKYPQAVKELAVVVTKHPKSRYAPPARLQLGLAQLAAGQVPQARKTLALVAGKDKSRWASAKYWLAQCDMAEKKHAAAAASLSALAKAKPAPPNLPAILYDLAVCTMATGKHAEAAGQFQAFAARYPKDPKAPDATYRRAFCLHKLRKYPESLALCQALAKTPPGPARTAAEELAAENLFLMGKYAEAAKALAQQAKTAKNEGRKLAISLRLGQCAFLAKNYAGAIKLLKPLAANSKVAADENLREAIFVLGDAQLQSGRAAEAAATLARYVPLAKANKAEASFKLALAQLRSGRTAQASQAFAALMNAPGGSPWAARAAFEYGQLCYRQGKPAQAAPALAKVIAAKAPPELTAAATYFLAWIDFDAAKHAAAARKFARVVTSFPKSTYAPEAAYQQALCLKEAGQFARALAQATAYLKAHPKGKHAAEAQYLAGTCLARLDRHAEAIKTLSALSATKSATSQAALYDLAWSQQKTKATDAAILTYRKLLTDYPAGRYATQARVELAELLYSKKVYPEAVKLLKQALADKAAPAKLRPDSLHRLAWCHARLGDHAQAAAGFSDFAAKYPKDERAPTALYQAGYCLALTKEYAKAEKQFAALLRAHPTHSLADTAYVKLGEVQASAGQFARSRQTYAAMLKTFPKSKYAFLARCGTGWALQNLKKYSEARKWYAQVTAGHRGPTAAKARFMIGETYFLEGKYSEAIRAYLTVKAAYAYPEWSARALLGAGRAFEALKDPDKAASHYAQCAKEYKDTGEGALAAKALEALKKAKP